MSPVIYFPYSLEKYNFKMWNFQLSNLQSVMKGPSHWYKTDIRVEDIIVDQQAKISPFRIFNRNSEFINAQQNSIQTSTTTKSCFLFNVGNRARPFLLPIACFLKVLPLVLCEVNQTEPSNFTSIQNTLPSGKYANYYRCADGTYLSMFYVCDGKNDCPMYADDELNCTCKQKGKFITDNIFCSQVCHPGDCLCPILFRQSIYGGCKIYSHSTNYTERNILSEPMLYNCTRMGPMIDKKLVNDLLPDCPKGEDEYTTLVNDFIYQNKYNCPEQNMLECYPGHTKCYSEKQKCFYDIDQTTFTLKNCRNGKHLEDCQNFKCPSRFKCWKSYCIPHSYICDGKWDCWNGDDESSCFSRTCQHLYKCAHSSICIPLTLLCDSSNDCNDGDDEHMCHVCPHGCICLGFAIECKYVEVDFTFLFIQEYSFVHISFSFFHSFFPLKNVSSVFFPQNNLTTFWDILQDEIFNFLKVLDVSRNKISRIFHPFKGIKAFKLQHLNLSTNVILNIENFGVDIFISLSILDLSNNYISILKNNVFNGLVSLKELNLFNNPLTIVRLNIFVELHLHFVISNNYQVCCATKIHNIRSKCTSQIQRGSPCGNLLRDLFFISITLIQSIIITLCNAVSIYWYMFTVKHKNRRGFEKNNFQCITSLLHIFSCLYGIYLGIISIISLIKGDKFIEEYCLWKCGIFCYFLSTESFLCIFVISIVTLQISVIRYIAVKYPLKAKSYHHNMKSYIKKLILLLTVISCLLPIFAYFVEHKCISSPLCNFLGYSSQSFTEKFVAILTSVILIICSFGVVILSVLTFKIKYSSQNEVEITFKSKINLKHLAVNLFISSLSFFIISCPVSILFMLSVFTDYKSQKIIDYYTILVVYPIYPIISTFIYSSEVFKTIYLKVKQFFLHCSLTA